MEMQDQLDAAFRARREAEERASQEVKQRENLEAQLQQMADQSARRRPRMNLGLGFITGIAVTSLVAVVFGIPRFRLPDSTMKPDVAGMSSTPTALLSKATPSATPEPTPTEAPVKIAQLAAAEGYVCIVTEEGGVKCKDSISAEDPWMPVEGLDRGVKSVAPGADNVCALLSDGGVKCRSWRSPEQIMSLAGLDTGVTSIVVGRSHGCALTDRSEVKCWSYNGNGNIQLKNGNTYGAYVVQEVVGLNRGVKMIAAGANHTCALLDSGSVKCWGTGASGQLGNGWTSNESVPQEVIGLNRGVKMIAAGADHSCAVLDNGGVKCWGAGTSGQLGNGGMTDSSTPQEVMELGGKADMIDAGEQHTCALMSSRIVKCWGSNSMGQMGEMPPALKEDTRTPQEAVDFSDDAITITVDRWYTCVLTIRNEVKCKGSIDKFAG